MAFSAAGAIHRLHDRMPVMLAPETLGAWLSGNNTVRGRVGYAVLE